MNCIIFLFYNKYDKVYLDFTIGDKKMKKCVVYYSKTGNTKEVAQKLKDFDLLEIKAQSDDPNVMNPILTEIPDFSAYDYVVFATPVHGFQISKIMKAYLEQAKDYSGKTIDLFITHFFPFAWMGGNSSLKQMKKIIESKHGVVRQMTSVNWKSKKKDRIISQMIDAYHE